MKKLFVLFLCLFATDSHSSGIGNVSSAPCDNATLDKYTGTANVEINWEPNTIGLKWFNGEEQINGQTSCVYDGTITVPPTPTKPGYTFNGWKIPKYDFSTIPTDVNGTERWAKDFINGAEKCYYAGTTGDAQVVTCTDDENYRELQQYQWKVKYSHGALYGIYGCSITDGEHGQTGTPAIDTGQYCWCKATGYKLANSNIINNSLYSLYWVLGRDSTTINECERSCAAYCVNAADYILNFRTALFTPAQ